MKAFVRGAIVALVTPFTDEGEVDFETLKELVEWQIQEGIDAIVSCGSTGEAPTLSSEERVKIYKTVIDVAHGRVPVWCGTGTYDTRKTVLETREAKRLGADACFIVVPYYIRPTPEGLLAHYREIDKVGLPMVVYSNPVRTGIAPSAELLAEIGKLSTVVAIKEASGTVEIARELKKISDVPLLSGDDTLAYDMMEAGAVGVVSIVANVIPRAWKEMTASFLAGNLARAKEIDEMYAPLYRAMVLETNPQCVKYAMGVMGKCKPHLRLPLVQPRDATKLKIMQVVREAELVCLG